MVWCYTTSTGLYIAVAPANPDCFYIRSREYGTLCPSSEKAVSGPVQVETLSTPHLAQRAKRWVEWAIKDSRWMSGQGGSPSPRLRGGQVPVASLSGSPRFPDEVPGHVLACRRSIAQLQACTSCKRWSNERARLRGVPLEPSLDQDPGGGWLAGSALAPTTHPPPKHRRCKVL